MKTEVDLWKTLRPALITEVGGRWNRIENIAGVGNPDVNYCAKSREGWVELKFAYKVPGERSRKGVFGYSHNHGLSKEQENWHLQQASVGGRSFIFGYVPGEGGYLIRGDMAGRFNGMDLVQLKLHAVWDTHHFHSDRWHGLGWALIDLTEAMKHG